MPDLRGSSSRNSTLVSIEQIAVLVVYWLEATFVTKIRENTNLFLILAFVDPEDDADWIRGGGWELEGEGGGVKRGIGPCPKNRVIQ
jgi:hypothetical protein